ncbi:MAG: 4-hydroxythreonine-4-phosphate dehydrogenase PdxA, partial [Thermomicrobiales bacterium]
MPSASWRPLLAVTMGDPSGIGPEVILKALAHADVYEHCRPLVIGDARILRRAAGWLPAPGLEIAAVTAPEDGRYVVGR